MTVLSRHQFHPRHVDALPPLLRLPVAVNPEQIMTLNPEMVGRSLEHSFKALGLGLGATETEVKVTYRALARIYHPDKHDPKRTGMMHAEASEHFKIINNAQAYLCEVL